MAGLNLIGRLYEGLGLLRPWVRAPDCFSVSTFGQDLQVSGVFNLPETSRKILVRLGWAQITDLDPDHPGELWMFPTDRSEKSD